MNKADKRYRKLVKEKNAEGVPVIKGLTDSFNTWYCISEKEAEVFDLNIYLINSLCIAYERFMNLCGIANSFEFTNEERRADWIDYAAYLPAEFDESEPHLSIGDISMFMKSVCGLPPDQCWKYVMLRDIRDLRSGLIDYKVTVEFDQSLYAEKITDAYKRD